MPRSTKPLGFPTRGRTASNRLRRVDNFILLYEPSLLTRTNDLFVDLGYGFDPRTTLESAERFRRVNPDLKILGVEIDKERVEAAQPYADEKTFFRLGGFNLPLKAGEHVRLIRAFNVLRQYEEADVAPAYEMLARGVLPGGLMVEGTSNPFGSIWCANVARRMESGSLLPYSQQQAVGIQKWTMEALVFSTNFRLGFEPAEFQTILPKNLIHRVVPGEPVYDFFEAWKRSAAETAAAKIYGPRQWFTAAAERLSARGYDVALQRKWLSRGYLIWRRG
jgi:hypothetical protein